MTQTVSEETCQRAKELSGAWRRKWEERKKKLKERKFPEPFEYKKLIKEKKQLEKLKSKFVKELSQAKKKESEEGKKRVDECLEKLAELIKRFDEVNENCKIWRKKHGPSDKIP